MMLQDGKILPGNMPVIDLQELEHFRQKYPIAYSMIRGMIERKEIRVVPDMSIYFIPRFT
jgi:hypothetical protein